MTNERGNQSHPPAVDQAVYQSELDKLRAREPDPTYQAPAKAPQDR